MPTSVALTPYFESYTKHLVASGRYNNVSEVIRDSLEQLGSDPNAVHLSKDAVSSVVNLEFKGVAHGRQSSNLAVRCSPC